MRDIVTKDFWWKLFAVLLAVLIWFTVDTISNEGTRPGRGIGMWQTRTFTNLPVLVTSAAADVREFRFNPETVTVTVSASPEIMAAITENEIQPTVNLTDIDSARSLLMRVKVSAPAGVTPIRVIPADVNVMIPPKRDDR
jgi:hypothetical protein